MIKPTQEQIEYWKKREHAYEAAQKDADEAISKRMDSNLKAAKAEIEKDINIFYERFGSKNGMSIEEAHKAVADVDIKAYEAKAKEYVKQARAIEKKYGRKATKADFTSQVNQEMEIYNATMKLNRLELLKANLNLTLAKATSNNEVIIHDSLKSQIYSEIKRQAGILGENIRMSEKDVTALVNGDYQASTFSKKLWNNHAEMMSEIGNNLRRAVTAGVNPVVGATVFQRHFENTINKNSFNAKRLLVTETARVQADAQAESFKQSGYDKYVYIAESKACDTCRVLDGKVYEVKDRHPGGNCFPMHPFCRCSTAPYADRDEMERLIKLANEETLRRMRE